ncbi:hypothetical protein AOQ84DRAFT_351544 [Glonium stellatum]|uniref:Uncharacterized protein n=1 Tax=Glonium stellatum TaxID=574774 RepID=A0A8E2FCA9_9PEZI|nr:hypothetical protein AOQ84DRAFT_351544 [Glonium stellatum]
MSLSQNWVYCFEQLLVLSSASATLVFGDRFYTDAEFLGGMNPLLWPIRSGETQAEYDKHILSYFDVLKRLLPNQFDPSQTDVALDASNVISDMNTRLQHAAFRLRHIIEAKDNWAQFAPQYRQWLIDTVKHHIKDIYYGTASMKNFCKGEEMVQFLVVEDRVRRLGLVYDREWDPAIHLMSPKQQWEE